MEVSNQAQRDGLEKTVGELGDEIGRRSAEQMAAMHRERPGEPIQLGRLIANQAKLVLLDWFLGHDGGGESRELRSGRDTGD